MAAACPERPLNAVFTGIFIKLRVEKGILKSHNSPMNRALKFLLAVLLLPLPGVAADCGTNGQTILNDGNARVLYLPSPVNSAADGPAGWLLPGFDDSSWQNAVVWPDPPTANVLGPGISWFSYSEDPYSTPAGAQDALLVRATFTLPDSFNDASASFDILSDDAMNLWINGQQVFSEPVDTVTTWQVRQFAFDTSVLQPGENTLAILVTSSVVEVIGYSYRLHFEYFLDCSSEDFKTKIKKLMAAPNPIQRGLPAQLHFELTGPATRLRVKAFTLGHEKVFEQDSTGLFARGHNHLDISTGDLPAGNIKFRVEVIDENGGIESHMLTPAYVLP